MSTRRTLLRGVPARALGIALAVPAAALVAPAPSVQAAPPVRALLARAIAPQPAGADALRVRIHGDKSGARVQMRLLAPAQNGTLSGASASKTITVDFSGWKTVTLPLSEFTFTSDTNPEAARDGLSSPETIASSTGLQIAVVAANARILFNDFAWVKADAGAEPTPLAAATTTDAASAKEWVPVGDQEQIKAVSFSIANAPASPVGTPSLQMVVRNPALEEQQVRKPIVTARLRSTPFALYTRPTFETIVAESVPTVAEMTNPQVSLTACADETEAASLAVYAARPITGATLKVQGPLLSATRAALPATAVDVRVVKVAEVLNGPQLLMKDDRQPLTGPLPTVRLTGDPATDVPAGTSKQFWITVRVPRNQKPGTYTGKLVFSGQGAKPTGVPITIVVPDLQLKTAFLQYGIDLPTKTAGDATPEQFAQYLANIRDHNVRLITLYDAPSELATGLRLYKEANLSQSGPVVAASLTEPGQIAAIEGQKSAAGLSPNFSIYYRVPSAALQGGTVASYSQALNNVNGALLITDIDSSESYKALSTALNDTSGDKFAPIYPISSDYAQTLITNGKRTTLNRDYLSWNIPTQSPLRNRLFSGFLLYKTGPGVYGAFPGPYQANPGDNPFAAFAPDAANADPSTLPQMTTFPVQGGVLDTVQWEAVREGIDDIRYIGAMKSYVRELKDAKRGKEAVAASEAFLAKRTQAAPLSLNAAALQQYRAGILREALKLKAVLLGKK